MSSGLLQVTNSETFTELPTTSFIESTGVTRSDSVSHNRVQVLSIPVSLLACSQDWTCDLQLIVALEADFFWVKPPTEFNMTKNCVYSIPCSKSKARRAS